MKLADKCDIYMCGLKDTKHPNSGYKAEQLKKQLVQTDFHWQKLSFSSLNSGGKFNHTLCTILT